MLVLRDEYGRVMGDELKLTLLEKTKVQAEVLVPLIRAMEEEMGRESAHRLASTNSMALRTTA